MARQDIFAACRSGVAQVCLERDGDRLTAGSAFLVNGGLITNSHVLRSAQFDVAVIRFEDMDYEAGIRLDRNACLATVAHESPSEEHDVLFLRLAEQEFEGRHVFALGSSENLRVGDEIGFLGYPFRKEHLTCHVGHVSNIHASGVANVIQIDGSVNGGNSGGPLIELSEGHVVGIVTRAEVGFLAEQFEELIRTLTRNVELLQQPAAKMLIHGVDPIQALAASQAAMRDIAETLKRSANVGIGYAFCAGYIRDRIEELSARNT